MITFEHLCGILESTINELLIAHDDGFIGARKYRFILHRDAGTYKTADKIGNDVTRYINGQVQIVNQQNDTTTDGSTNSVYQLQIELLVPITNANSKALISQDIESVRQNLDSYFSTNTNAFITDEDNKVYSYTQKSSIGRSVMRQMYNQVGDAVSFLIYSNWTFVEQGAPSRLMRIALDGNILPFATVAINRESAMERHIPSKTETIDSVTVPTSSAFTITVQLPTKLSAGCAIITRALLEGDNNTAHLVTVTVPLEYDTEEGEIGVTMLEKSYYMTIRSNGLSGEHSLNATTSVAFDLADMSTGIMTLSEYAQTHPIE